MTDQTVERFFGFRHALDNPVTRWILIGIGGLLVVSPIIMLAMGIVGRLKPEHKKELWLRYRSWPCLAVLMIAPILFSAAATILAVGILAVLCYREFARATGLFRENLTSAVVVLGILAVTFAALDNWYGLFLALAPLGIVVIAAANVFQDRPKGYIQRVGLGALAFMLFGSGLGHLGYIANDQLFRPILLMLLVTVELNDVFAYCTGKLFGRHKLHSTPAPTRPSGASARSS